jgi:NAD+ kinase
MAKRTQASLKKISIVYRFHSEQAVQSAKSLSKWLKAKGHEALTAPAQEVLPGAPLATPSQFQKTDLVIVLGGDGTYLRAVRMLEGQPIPILGFNMGSLGFLTVHPVGKMKELIQKFLLNKMQMRPVAMIEARVCRGKKIRGEYHALNDIVIERGSYSQLINAAVFLGSSSVSNLKADGFIVSSPTGSTAYNLAAGGPILDAGVRAFAITPVAAHALTTRPLVVPDDVLIRFQLSNGRDQKGHFVVDGQKQLELTNEDEIEIRRSAFDHLMLREQDFNSYGLLKEKLKFGDRA